MKKLSIIIGVLIALFANVENAFGTYYYGGAGDGFDAGGAAGSAGAPSVTTITPSSGSNASMVTIYLTGTNFFAGTASSAVTLVRFDDGGSTALGFGGASISDTSINGVLVPSGIQPGTYNVRVSTTAGTNTTSGDKFVVTAPSQVSIPSIIPAAGTFYHPGNDSDVYGYIRSDDKVHDRRSSSDCGLCHIYGAVHTDNQCNGNGDRNERRYDG